MRTEVEYLKTTLSRSGAQVSLQAAFLQRFGRAPTRNELAMLLSQSEHETAGWTRMPNWNWGGVKAFKSWTGDFVQLKTTEGSGADAKRVLQPFRAYATAIDGCLDWLSVLAHGWPGALVAAASGIPSTYTHQLRYCGVRGAYFTGSTDEYQTRLTANFERWKRELPPDANEAELAQIAPKAAPGTYVTVAGYHRAKQAEVTPDIAKAAQAALKEMRLGEIRYGRGYALGCETRSNAAKGISVFVPDFVGGGS